MFKKKGALLAVVAAMLTYGGAAQADYFVRPYVGADTGAVQDGLVINGVTSKTVGFGDAARTANATVDLATGSLKAYAEQDRAAGFSYANAIMGDTITFRGGNGTAWDFGFTLDGVLSGQEGPVAPGNLSSTGIAYALSFAVYRPGQVNHENWFSQAGGTVVPLFFEDQTNRFTVPGENPFGAINDSISGSLMLDSDYEVFEIYARVYASAGADVATGLVSSVADFSHTGTVDFNYDDSVTAYSESGVFLGLARDPGAPVNVPEPGNLALILAGLLGAAVVVRRRRE